MEQPDIKPPDRKRATRSQATAVNFEDLCFAACWICGAGPSSSEDGPEYTCLNLAGMVQTDDVDFRIHVEEVIVCDDCAYPDAPLNLQRWQLPPRASNIVDVEGVSYLVYRTDPIEWPRLHLLCHDVYAQYARKAEWQLPFDR